METTPLAASVRKESGKGAARRLRSQQLIPAVVYGKDLPPLSLSVSPKDVTDVIGSVRGRNSVIELDIEGDRKLTVLLCDYQYHPVTRRLLHADFLQIHPEKAVDVEVPFELQGRPQGVVMGGTLRQVFRKLPVRCLPGQIPVKITHDVAELGLDEHVPVKALSLPEGVTIRLPAEQTVAAVVAERRRQAEAEAAAGEGGEAKAAS